MRQKNPTTDAGKAAVCLREMADSEHIPLLPHKQNLQGIAKAVLKLGKQRDALLLAARNVRIILREAQRTGTFFGESLEADKQRLDALSEAIAEGREG